MAQKYDVQKVILFGSRARDDYKSKSDIDLDKPVQDELSESVNREGIILYEKV